MFDRGRDLGFQRVTWFRADLSGENEIESFWIRRDTMGLWSVSDLQGSFGIVARLEIGRSQGSKGEGIRGVQSQYWQGMGFDLIKTKYSFSNTLKMDTLRFGYYDDLEIVGEGYGISDEDCIREGNILEVQYIRSDLVVSIFTVIPTVMHDQTEDKRFNWLTSSGINHTRFFFGSAIYIEWLRGILEYLEDKFMRFSYMIYVLWLEVLRSFCRTCSLEGDCVCYEGTGFWSGGLINGMTGDCRREELINGMIWSLMGVWILGFVVGLVLTTYVNTIILLLLVFMSLTKFWNWFCYILEIMWGSDNDACGCYSRSRGSYISVSYLRSHEGRGMAKSWFGDVKSFVVLYGYLSALAMIILLKHSLCVVSLNHTQRIWFNMAKFWWSGVTHAYFSPGGIILQDEEIEEKFKEEKIQGVGETMKNPGACKKLFKPPKSTACNTKMKIAHALLSTRKRAAAKPGTRQEITVKQREEKRSLFELIIHSGLCIGFGVVCIWYHGSLQTHIHCSREQTDFF